MTLYMNDWKATHKITVKYDHSIIVYDVMLFDEILYTQEEFESAGTADWTLENGTLLFQGRVPDCTEYACQPFLGGGV